MTAGPLSNSSASNCVRLRLHTQHQQGVAAAARMLNLRQELMSFGEIARVETVALEDGEPAMQVTYYDIRCAEYVQAAYGGEMCSYGPTVGCLSLKVRKEHLEHLALVEISEITCTESGDFMVEFFDTRVAAQAMAMLPEVIEDFGTFATPEATTRDEKESPSATSKPRFVNSFQMSQINWDDLANRREWRTTLQLRGLPRKMCEPGALEAVLKAQGLLESVQKVRVSPANGRGQGFALLRAKTIEDVQKLGKFLHGLHMGGSAPIAVSFAENQGKDPLRKQCVAGAAPPDENRSPSPSKTVNFGEPRHIRTCDSLPQFYCDALASDNNSGEERSSYGEPRRVSTSDSDGADSEVSFASRPPSPRRAPLMGESASPLQKARGMLPPGLRPPPGLEFEGFMEQHFVC